jgi:D-galactarolactone isomerase
LIRSAPERLVWGSNWPHPNAPEPKPDEAALLDLMGRWCPEDAARRAILVDNPARLYDF